MYYWPDVELDNNWVICSDKDRPRVYHREWGKSQREKQIYMNAYMCNLGKGYRWTYFQGWNRGTNTENGRADTGGKGGWDGWKVAQTYMCPHVWPRWPVGSSYWHMAQGAQPGALWWPTEVEVGWGGSGGMRRTYTCSWLTLVYSRN